MIDKKRPSNPEKKPTPPKEKMVDDLARRMEEAKVQYDEIKKQLDDFYLQTGWNPQSVKDFLNNPNNFTESEWVAIKGENDRLQQKLWEKVGLDKQKQAKAEEEKKIAGARKGKLLGSRKKWLPMK